MEKFNDFLVVLYEQWHWKDQLFHPKGPDVCAYLNNKLENLNKQKKQYLSSICRQKYKTKNIFPKIISSTCI